MTSISFHKRRLIYFEDFHVELTRPNQFTAMHFKEFTDKIKDSSPKGGTGLPHSQACPGKKCGYEMLLVLYQTNHLTTKILQVLPL